MRLRLLEIARIAWGALGRVGCFATSSAACRDFAPFESLVLHDFARSSDLRDGGTELQSYPRIATLERSSSSPRYSFRSLLPANPLSRPPTSGRLFAEAAMFASTPITEKAVAVAWWGAWTLLLVALIAFNLS